MDNIQIGDRVQCIEVPAGSQYKCKIYAEATVEKIVGSTLWMREEICTDKHISGACYDMKYFIKIPGLPNYKLWDMKKDSR